MKKNSEQAAKEFAAFAHKCQVRKYTNEPYINHCINVAGLVKANGGNLLMVCAAYLHDVVEDTTVTLNDIKSVFGDGVSSLVNQLTSEYSKEKYPLLNRSERKRLECLRIASITPEAQTIKYADIIDNISTINYRDPEFAKIYLIEKRKSLAVMNKGNHVLYRQACNLLA